MNLKPEVQVPLEKVIESRQDTPIPPPADYNGRAGDHPIYKNHISPNLHILEPIPYEDCLDGSDQVELSSQEIACFKSQGFIIKHGLIDEQEGFDRLVDYYWEHVPAYFMDRDDPTTWFMQSDKKLTVEDSRSLGRISAAGLKLQSPTQFGTESSVLALSANHPKVQRVVEQFIGSPVRRAKRVRGLYGVSPTPTGTSMKLSPHADIIPSDICAMVIVTETPPR